MILKPDRSLLDALTALVLPAGAECLSVLAGAMTVDRKADDSPVTEADRRAETVILERLARLYPGVPVISEEAACAGDKADVGREFFLVDPLDGTREFVDRNGEFTVNVALIHDGAPVAGVVYAPVVGTLYAGAGDMAAAARVEHGVLGALRPIRVRSADPDRLRAVGSRSHESSQSRDWRAARKVIDYTAIGSSLKFGLLADGSADLYARLSRTMEWDTGAGDAVLRCAGGLVVTLDGEPLRYGKRVAGEDDFANPSFLAVGDRRLLDRLL